MIKIDAPRVAVSADPSRAHEGVRLEARKRLQEVLDQHRLASQRSLEAARGRLHGGLFIDEPDRP
jgi:hypothetical protein